MCYLCPYLWFSVCSHESMSVQQITQIALDSSHCMCIWKCVQYVKHGRWWDLGCANMPSPRYSLQAGRTWLASTPFNNSYHTGLITYSSNTHCLQEHCHYLLCSHPCTIQGIWVSSLLLSWVQTAGGDIGWRGRKREENHSGWDGERLTSTFVNKGTGNAGANFLLIYNR